MNGFVYFLSDGDGAIKIGFSSDVRRRMAHIRTATQKAIQLIGHVPAHPKQEREIHRDLKSDRLKGEWFRDCATVRAVIADILEKGLPVYEPAPVEYSQPLQEAIRFGNIITRFSGLDGVTATFPEIEKKFGLRSGLLWMLRYRPSESLSITAYYELKKGAQSALASAASEIEAESDFINAICERERIAEEKDALALVEIARLKSELAAVTPNHPLLGPYPGAYRPEFGRAQAVVDEEN